MAIPKQKVSQTKIIFKYFYYYYYSITRIEKESKDAPEWFHCYPDWKVKQYKKFLADNVETVNIITKHQNWIMTSPRNYDRKYPIDKKKVINMKEMSVIVPKWMESKNKNFKKKEENLKIVEYCPLKQKCKKLMIFVDKDINPPKNKVINYDKNRSIFSFGDFRNNVYFKKEQEFYDSKVSHEPKKFFDWDDKKKFVPKYKKDV